MAEPRRVTVELSDFLADLDLVAMKNQLSAPIAWRADQLIAALPRKYGQVSYPELVSALIHGTEPDAAQLSALIEDYREDRVWQARQGFGPIRIHSGQWEIALRSQGGQLKSS
jgi:hypothetical protein